MADLERYQPSGVLFADVPRMDFANVREQARAAQGLTQALDRISDFAFKRAAQQAEREGQQWAYQNRVTPEQVKAAQERGEPLSLPAADTYFGASAREVQAQLLRGDLELQTRNEFAKMSAAVDAGLVKDIGDVQANLTAPIEGFAKILAQVDPQEAAKFRASMATVGNAVYSSAAKRLAEDYVQARKNEVTSSIESSRGVLSATVRSEFDPVMLRERLDLIQNSVVKMASDISPQFGEDTRKEFVKERRAAVVDVISTYLTGSTFAPTDTEALAKIERGDVGDYKAIWSGLSEGERNDIKKAVNTSQANRYAAEQRDRQELDQRNQRDFTKMYSEWVNPATPQRRKDELRSMMVPLAGGTGELDKLFAKTEDGEGDQLLFVKLRDEIYNGRINSPYQLFPYFRRGGINKKQLASLQTDIYDVDKPKIAAASKSLNRYAGVGDVISGNFDPKDAAFQKGQKLSARFESAVGAARDAQDALPPEKRTGIDYNGIAARIIQEYETEDKADAVKQKARKSLEGFEQIATRKGKTVRLDDRTSVADLERLGVFSGSELTAIKKNLDIIKRP
jgi:hypothetical protein